MITNPTNTLQNEQKSYEQFHTRKHDRKTSSFSEVYLQLL